MNWVLVDGDVMSLVLLHEVLISYGRDSVKVIAPTYESYRRNQAILQQALKFRVELNRFDLHEDVINETIRYVVKHDDGLATLFLPFNLSAIEVAGIYYTYRGKLSVHGLELDYEDAWRIAVEELLPLQLTYSCKQNDGHCGWCIRCKRRKEMVRKYGPTNYGELCEVSL